MTDTTKLFQLAQLAEASYAEFDKYDENKDGEIVKNESQQALTDKGFSPTQATEFSENWQVVHHQPNTTSGYSGTLFKYIGNDPNSGFTNGEYVFSLRGTEVPANDNGYQTIQLMKLAA